MIALRGFLQLLVELGVLHLQTLSTDQSCMCCTTSVGACSSQHICFGRHVYNSTGAASTAWHMNCLLLSHTCQRLILSRVSCCLLDVLCSIRVISLCAAHGMCKLCCAEHSCCCLQAPAPAQQSSCILSTVRHPRHVTSVTWCYTCLDSNRRSARQHKQAAAGVC